ncbi:hypothetical protein RFI_25524 [Reticulomyxa filosa]|uniref:Uncharacterized protein n=1 Tax=Reticulomyxa filosa TaxID=46433 RepID=X6MDX6_RETFI|nr:hypothetical protein RFI_25524 [Reticulomyxa filosa]|eukprot:ETO11851.1 hypothetical protein RFI_25524 [Reticulomyxa filosa]
MVKKKKGKKADFVAERLSDNRKKRGVAVSGEMTKQEKQDNVIVIIQVPLKQKPSFFHNFPESDGCNESDSESSGDNDEDDEDDEEDECENDLDNDEAKNHSDVLRSKKKKLM